MRDPVAPMGMAQLFWLIVFLGQHGSNRVFFTRFRACWNSNSRSRSLSKERGCDARGWRGGRSGDGTRMRERIKMEENEQAMLRHAEAIQIFANMEWVLSEYHIGVAKIWIATASAAAEAAMTYHRAPKTACSVFTVRSLVLLVFVVRHVRRVFAFLPLCLDNERDWYRLDFVVMVAPNGSK